MTTNTRNFPAAHTIYAAVRITTQYPTPETTTYHATITCAHCHDTLQLITRNRIGHGEALNFAITDHNWTSTINQHAYPHAYCPRCAVTQ